MKVDRIMQIISTVYMEVKKFLWFFPIPNLKKKKKSRINWIESKLSFKLSGVCWTTTLQKNHVFQYYS